MINSKIIGSLFNISRSVATESSSYTPLCWTKYLGTIEKLAGCSASLHTSCIDNAARKGTRVRKEAVAKANKKKNLEAEIRSQNIPNQLKKKMKFDPLSPRKNYTWKPLAPSDDVFVMTFFQWRIISLEEAIQRHRQTHHPTMYNLPNAPLYLFLELSHETNKKNRYLENVTNVVALPYQFETGQTRTLAVLTNCPETQEAIRGMGAQLVLGKEVVKMVKGGDVDLLQYDHVISSLEILPDLVPIRGLLKKAFPNPKTGTAVHDLAAATNRFLKGMKYEAIRDKHDLDYGHIELQVGTLNMDDAHIIANVKALMVDIDSHKERGRKSSELITETQLKCPPINEKFRLNHLAILGREPVEVKPSEETLEEEPETAEIAA